MTTQLPLLPPDQVERHRDEQHEAGVGTIATRRGNLPLEALDVHAEITGLIARTRLRQTFVNPFDEPLEATYIFPLPGRAAVTEFRMELADRTVRGVLQEREAARAGYDRAIAEGKRAAIAEEERQGVFTVRVGNLQPGERATVQLTLVGPLAYADGEATYRFPLVVAPRYIPGQPLPVEPVGDGVSVDTDAVPDASRITPPVLLPGFPNPVRLSIAAELDPAGLSTGEPRASLHTIVTEQRDGGRQVLRVTPGDRANRDFLLRFPVAEEGVRTALVVTADARDGDVRDGDALERDPGTQDPGAQDPGARGGDARAGAGGHAGARAPETSGVTTPEAARATADPGGGAAIEATEAAGGTFALTVVPPAGAVAAERPRDVVLVLDRSGSMRGWKIVAARRAAARIVDSLGDADRLAVLAFDHSVAVPPGLPSQALAPATDRNRYQAVEFLAGMEARGGTELLQALSAALDRLDGTGGEGGEVVSGEGGTGGGVSAGGASAADGTAGGRDRVLVLVTDGQIGDEDRVLRRLAPRLRGLRVFTVGIDRAVNAAFLQRLAGQGGGACELVESEDRLDEAMDRIHRRVGTPVLVGLALEDGGLGLDLGSVAPARLPDLFAGAPLLITGRWRARPGGGAPPGGAALTLTGRTADGAPWRVRVPAVPAASTALAPVWARARLRDLEDRYVTGDDDARALERELVATSLRFGVLCRFTAFVAVDERVVNEGGELRRITQPVDTPQDWDLLGEGAGGTSLAALAGSPPPAGLAGHAIGTAGYQASASPSPMRRLGGAQAFRGDWPDSGGIVEPAPRAPRLLKGRPGTPRRGEPAPLPERLGAERERARQLVTALDGAAGTDLARRLRDLEAALDELVERLRAAGAPEAALRPLADALRMVREALDPAGQSEHALDRAWREGVAALRAFAGEGGAQGGAKGAAPSPPGSRRGFWRRRGD